MKMNLIRKKLCIPWKSVTLFNILRASDSAFISCAQNAVDADNTAITGYPSDKIGQPQMMHDNRVYYYCAMEFDESLPEGYEFVGKVGAVDN